VPDWVFLSADLGVTPEVREANSVYIEGWLKVLKTATSGQSLLPQPARRARLFHALDAAETAHKSEQEAE